VSSVWSTSLLAPAAGDSGDSEGDDGGGGDEGVVVVVVVGRFDSAEAGDSDGGGGDSWCVGRERGTRLWRTLSIVASTERVCRRSAAIDSDGT